MSDLDRFELFTHTAELGSLTKAAARVNLSKASLSKQIKRLEKDLKVDLFLRSGRNLQLTEQGKLLLVQCLRLKKELDEARSVCQNFIEEPEGLLRIVASEYSVKKLIFPKLNAFMENYPKLDLIIDTHEYIPNFSDQQVDLAVGFSLPAGNEIIRSRILTSRLVLCATKQYFDRYGIPKKLRDLNDHKYITHTGHLNDGLRLKQGNNLMLKPYLVFNHTSSMIACAKQSLGLIQLPEYLLTEYLEHGEFIEVLTDYQLDKVHIYYYYPKHCYIQPKVRKFIDSFLVGN
ncbi:LysR family transcriptional regulator [Francisella halioticida]|uniref:HTH lysR-type domain-containing protein n=1 Tax=Francisella halioticida TaxID=549298 RepID=A0ABM6LZ65_9GAMM|nr:LysR family transcriptional regulator [Francisella halioticida]ASG67988.1 hypothetical protein CDV26_05955 [Francisella halioticida]BCD90467.1 LysR family transcriptional regulator [Francisella halioticida]